MHVSNFWFWLKKLSKKLSFRASAFAIFAVFISSVSVQLGVLVPKEWTSLIGKNALDSLLEILSSSMLLVVTFSLATMVSAYATASQGVTPRATRLLLEDRKSQNVISIFLGVFIFSVITMVALSTTYKDDGAKFILFLVTSILIFMVIVTIIGWVDSLARLGRVHETIVRLESATRKALVKRAKHRTLDCSPYSNEASGGQVIFHSKVGYLQTFNPRALEELAKEMYLKIYVEVQPGSYVTRSQCICRVRQQNDSNLDSEIVEKIQGSFIIDQARSFEDDPRFGFISLGEVASKALSPAVNDPGTAIDVLSSAMRLFDDWNENMGSEQEIKYPHVYVREFKTEQLFKNIILPLCRDGAGHIEVILRLLKVLRAIGRMDPSELKSLAKHYESILVARAQKTLKYDDEQLILKEALLV